MMKAFNFGQHCPNNAGKLLGQCVFFYGVIDISMMTFFDMEEARLF